MAYAASEEAAPERGTGAQQGAQDAQHHSLGVYLRVWGLLFVLSVLSYLCDFLDESFLKWFLICMFMMLKAGLIVAIFMHMAWERMAIQVAILVPTGVLLVLMGLMALEAQYTFFSRLQNFLTG